MTTRFENTPPGSDEALEQGCMCPVLDNSHGKGAWGYPVDEQGRPSYWINAACPLHGTGALRSDKGGGDK